MVTTRGMKRALASKSFTNTNSASRIKKSKTKMLKRVYPMRTCSSTSKHLTESSDDLDDDDDIDTFGHRLYCAENEIVRLSNQNGSLSLKLQASLKSRMIWLLNWTASKPCYHLHHQVTLFLLKQNQSKTLASMFKCSKARSIHPFLNP